MTWWRDRAARAGGLLLAATVVIALAAPLLAPYDPRAQDRERFHEAPSLPSGDCALEWLAKDLAGQPHLFGFRGCRAYLLGTDALGRDVLSRVLWGARWTVGTALSGVLLTVAFGTLVGAVAGFLGGSVDRTLMRLTELFMALPALYLVLAVRGLFPDHLRTVPSYFMLVFTLAAVSWCGVARLVRAQVLALRERDFVLSARAAGASRRRLLFSHVLPNTFPFLLLQAGLVLPQFVLGEAALSFLGLGLQEPEPSWGNMLAAVSSNYTAMTSFWWTLWSPAGALTLVVLGANLWIEGVRRAYFPGSGWASKQRRQRAS